MTAVDAERMLFPAECFLHKLSVSNVPFGCTGGNTTTVCLVGQLVGRWVGCCGTVQTDRGRAIEINLYCQHTVHRLVSRGDTAQRTQIGIIAQRSGTVLVNERHRRSARCQTDCVNTIKFRCMSAAAIELIMTFIV